MLSFKKQPYLVMSFCVLALTIITVTYLVHTSRTSSSLSSGNQYALNSSSPQQSTVPSLQDWTTGDSSSLSDSSKTDQNDSLSKDKQPSQEIASPGNTVINSDVNNNASSGIISERSTIPQSITPSSAGSNNAELSPSPAVIQSASVMSAPVSRGDLPVPAAYAAQSPSDNSSSVLPMGQQVIEYAKTLQGVRYVYGGETPNGFDCSGFTKYVFKKFGIQLQRVAASQATQGTKISKNDLMPGDLVFFDTDGGANYINHVGIYIGNGQFIEASSASSANRVVIADLSTGFYAKSFMTARRVISSN